MNEKSTGKKNWWSKISHKPKNINQKKKVIGPKRLRVKERRRRRTRVSEGGGTQRTCVMSLIVNYWKVYRIVFELYWPMFISPDFPNITKSTQKLHNWSEPFIFSLSFSSWPHPCRSPPSHHKCIVFSRFAFICFLLNFWRFHFHRIRLIKLTIYGVERTTHRRGGGAKIERMESEWVVTKNSIHLNSAAQWARWMTCDKEFRGWPFSRATNSEKL